MTKTVRTIVNDLLKPHGLTEPDLGLDYSLNGATHLNIQANEPRNVAHVTNFRKAKAILEKSKELTVSFLHNTGIHVKRK